jgi:hypothetical protein
MFKAKRFEAKLGNMRKPQNFIVCPVSTDEENIRTIQSDKRIARVNLETGKVILSDGKGGHQGFHKLMEFAGAKEYDAPQEVLDFLTEETEPSPAGPVALTGPVNIFDL